MTGQRYMNIPREQIPWYPAVDTDKCVNCGQCLDFCSNEVFESGETAVRVANPFNCVVGCNRCARVCPNEALSFPTQEQLKEMFQRLREQQHVDAQR